MTVCLDLLRHGETEQGGGLRGSIDDALTATGWAQLRETLARLQTQPLDGDAQARPRWNRIVSSPLQRCARFAEEVAEAQRIPLTLEPGLQELHFGDWEGLTAAQVMQRDEHGLGQFWADPYAFTPPNAEPLLQFETRVMASVERLQERFHAERILLVTHGGVMRLLLAKARGLPRSDLLQVNVMHAQLVTLQLEARGVMRELP